MTMGSSPQVANVRISHSRKLIKHVTFFDALALRTTHFSTLSLATSVSRERQLASLEHQVMRDRTEQDG